MIELKVFCYRTGNQIITSDVKAMVWSISRLIISTVRTELLAVGWYDVQNSIPINSLHTVTKPEKNVHFYLF